MNHSDLSTVFGMKPQDAKSKLELLSPREMEVAELMAMGMANTQIAQKLQISRKTLDIHRGKIKRKLQTTIQGIGRIWFLTKLSERNGNS